MSTRMNFSGIQKGLVLFWAVWLSLVSLTNVCDALKSLDVLPENWTLASYNFDLVRSAVGTHGVPVTVAAVLFAGVIAWEILASALLWRAFAAMLRGQPGTSPAVTQAFFVSLALWAAFLIATEATVDYLTAGTHKATLIAQLVTLIVVRAGAESLMAEPAAKVDRSLG